MNKGGSGNWESRQLKKLNKLRELPRLFSLPSFPSLSVFQFLTPPHHQEDATMNSDHTPLAAEQMNTELVKYDAMVRSIAECKKVDEVKDIRDKALALEAYAKQALNYEAERQCAEIRVRAERQCGIMLAQMGKAKRGPDKSGSGQRSQRCTSDSIKTLDEMNITPNQSSKWQQLAEVLH